jgi:ATP-dependent exoDNAse (exonuclease V) beta subunit
MYDAIDTSAGTMLSRLPDDWRMPKFEMSVAWQPTVQRAPAAARKVTFEWVGDASRHAGTVIHEIFKRIAIDGLEKWNEARVEASKPLIREELLRLGVPAVEEPQASNQVVRALSNCLSSPRGRWLLSEHAEGRSEYAVGGRMQDKLVAATVDRVFRDEEGRFWIVDFKNSDHKGGKKEDFLREEQRRYTPQLETYAALLRRVKTGPIMLGLYFPLLNEWREWSFAAEVAADI